MLVRRRPRIDALLCDRDGTLVIDVPYNADPTRVRAMPGAAAALARARSAGLAVAIVTNQSGLARGFVQPEDVAAVNARVGALLGRFDVVQVCPHEDADGCACRKPAAGLVTAAALALDLDPARCVVIGDTAADVEAARRAGAVSVLVPTGRTRPDEIASAPTVAPTIGAAVDLALAGDVRGWD